MRASPVSHLLLSNLLSVDRIRIPIEALDKAAVIGDMCAFLADTCGATTDEAREIEDAVLERETVFSTGIGGGVAIPHGKSEAMPELVLVAGRTAEPVDFDALDGRPVRLIFLLIGPESAADTHIKVLSRIGRVLRSEPSRRRLVAAASPADFHAALKTAETF